MASVDENKELLIQCTNCKVSRKEEKFIGKSGNIVKRCLKCREKEVSRKLIPLTGR